MATDQLDRSKQEHLDDDERNNPSGVSRDLYRQENDAIDGYDRNKDGLDDHPVSGGDASGKSGDLNDRENNTMNYRPSNYGGKKSERGRPWSKANVKAVLKNKKVIGLIVGVGAIGGVGLGSLLMGALAPIAFLENVTKDLDTQVAAIDVRGTSIFRNKIPKDANKVLTGCTTLSIRCKMKTISTEQKNRLAAKGIDVVDEKKAKVGGKWRSQPTKYKFQNVEYDARAFATEIRKPGSPLRTAYTRANNMKFLGMADASFKRVMNRFGISKKPPELKGSKKDKINTLMNKTGSTDTKDISFTKYTDENGKDYYELDGDNTDPKTRYRGDQKDTMEKALAGAKTSAPPSRAKTNTIKGLSVLGAADLACTVKNMIGLATVAAKVANQVELAQYAMRVASTVQKVQSGYGDVDDGEVIGEFFGATDSRRQIVDVDKAIESKGSGKSATVGPVDGDVPMKNNPNYGKSAMDSPLYQLSSSTMYSSTGSTESLFSLGVGQNSVLKGYAGAADFLSVSDPVCKVVQNWFVRGAGLITGLALAFGSFGATLVPQAALAAGMFIATMTLQAVIDNALSGSIIGEGMEAAPVERGAAVWTGMASIHAQSAQTRGMIPGTAKQIAAYNGILNEVNNTYIAAERAESGPFDINNQYSFLGSFSRSLLPYFSASKDVASTTGSVLSLTGKSFASLFGSATSYAATLDEERFKVCDDVNYLEMGLAPDVQCNLRFVMPQPDLNRDVEDVIDYMENNGYVEKDTTTGLPIGYEPPTPQQSQGFAMNMLNGVKDSFYNSRNYGEGKGAEYGKFLDYCAYRSLPFGKTFDEGGAYGAVDEDWLTGKRCLGDDEMISNFRVYTMDKSVSEAMDEDEIYQQSETVEEIDQSDVVESTGKWAAPAPAYSVLSQRFGNPVAYNSAVPIGGGRFGHNGADISGTQKSEQVFAACDGVIAYTTYPSMNQGERTNANTIVIDCGGETSVGYHHATLDSSLKVGSRITAGSKLGRTDNSGNWGGWHIHLTVKVKGSFVDPIPYFKDKGIQLLK